ncbi:MAG: ferredoxin [Bacilli bacterium]|nr:ferredoxin [Bacilli bacterium]
MFFVEKDKCIGCGSCVNIAPEVFEFDSDNLAKAKENVGDEFKDIGMEALENCPTNAIVYKEKE